MPKSALSARAARTQARSRARLIGPIRLTIACAVALSLIISAAAGLFLYSFRERVLAESERELLNTSSILAKQIEHFFATVENVQSSIIQQNVFGIFDSDKVQDQLSRYDVHSRLRDKTAGMPYLGSLTVINAKGRVINFSRQWPIPDIDVTDRDFFRALQSDPDLMSFVSEPVRNRATGTWVIHLANKILAPNGEFLGLLSAAFELQYLQNYFSEIMIEPESGIALFRDDGILLARFPRVDSQIGRRFPTAVAMQVVANGNSGVGTSTGMIDGHVRVVAAHRIGGYPVVVTASKTLGAILAGWRKTAIYITCITVLTVFTIAAFALMFVRLFRNYQALTKARAEREKAEQMHEQSLRFDVALNNMTQGLVMFDSSARIVVCNDGYLQMYGLSREFVKPGVTLLELIEQRKKTRSFPGDPMEYCAGILSQISKRHTASQIVETTDGRTIHIVNQPMANGGWIATHEDVTAAVRAKQTIEQQKLQLDTALENISQGICMFDADQRLIIWNKRYANLYGLNEDQIGRGTTLRTILELRLANGTSAENQPNYVASRIDAVSKNEPYQVVHRLLDGRYVSIVHRPMPGGGWVSTHEDVTEANRREDSFRLLFDANPVPLWVTDRKTLRFLAVNGAAIKHYGYSREQFMSMTVLDIRPQDDRGNFEKFIRGLPDDQLLENLGRHLKADGTVITVAVSSRTLIYAGHEARLAVIHDITKAKRAKDELRRIKLFLDAVIENVPVPILVKDFPPDASDARNGRFALVNRACEEIMGVSRDKIIGRTLYDLFPKDRADFFVERDRQTLRSDSTMMLQEHALVTPGNGTRLVTAKKTAIRDDSGKPRYLLTVLDDVTERRQAAERIWHLAHNDSLTNLPNRSTFIEYLSSTLEQASKSSEQFAILCLDLDRFKEVNDVYGHMVGDGLLCEAARRLKAASGDAFLARVGGDEFILIARQGAGQGTAEALGDRLIAAFGQDFEVDGYRFQLGLSIGGVIYPNDGTDAKMLMANADAALYQAKAEARGSVRFFEANLAARLRERRNVQNDLRTALSNGEFFLHYQPQKRIVSNDTIGFESLVRWKCPKRGLVAPDAFIPIAEESSLIIPLGEWILREACREAASWPQPLKIAVNVSPIQLHHGDLPKLVHSVLLETGLTPNRLELEITEGVLVDDFSRAVSILRKLKSLGVQIAMDDFGSGYSSLSYLHAFPFDKIKIDRTFIGDLEHSQHSMAIVRAIIALGHHLNVPILAEGVETETQRHFLAQEGCDELQGYLTGRPLPIEDYAELIGRTARAKKHYARAR